MKRLALPVLVLCLFVLALPVFAGGQKDEAGGPVTINWYAHANTFDNTQTEIIKAFNEEYPDINVRLIELPENTSDKLAALLIALQSGDGSIDLYNADVTWTPIFAAADWRSLWMKNSPPRSGMSSCQVQSPPIHTAAKYTVFRSGRM